MELINFTQPMKDVNTTSVDFGNVYLYKNRVYRTVSDEYKNQVENLMSNKILMDKLYDSGLIETSIAPLYTRDSNLILEHRLIDFDSYIHEWAPPARLDASLMVIRLLKELVIGDWCLWDGHCYNVLMDFTEPRWIDFHSIIPYTNKVAWFNEFKHFIFDVVGGNSAVWQTELHLLQNKKQTILGFLTSIETHLMKIKPVSKETPWFTYPRLDDKNLDDKQKSTLPFMEQIKPYCETFLDIGGNVGWYSQAASRLGYKVILTDVDEACITEAYYNAKANNDNILPLVTDFKQCLDILPGEYKSFASRLACDATLSLALLHHLVFFQHCDFPYIVKRLNALSKKYAIVQFITREDSYVKHWLKSTTKDWYTIENFIAEMGKYFSKHSIVDSAPVGRKLILFER